MIASVGSVTSYHGTIRNMTCGPLYSHHHRSKFECLNGVRNLNFWYVIPTGTQRYALAWIDASYLLKEGGVVEKGFPGRFRVRT